MQFQVKIEEIGEAGLDYERELPQDFLESSLTDDIQSSYHAAASGKLRGHFDKLPGRVLFSGHIDVTVKAECKRCLREVVRKNPVDFKMTFVHERRDVQAALGDDGEELEDAGPKNGSFGESDVDTEPFDGETIRLDPLIREEILLNLPMDVLCQAECKGLCSVCGQDLNERECGHDRKIPDPRWSALKDLKLPN